MLQKTLNHVGYNLSMQYLELKTKLIKAPIVKRDNKYYRELYDVNFNISLTLNDLNVVSTFDALNMLEGNIFEFIINNKIICPNIEDSLEFDEIYNTYNQLFDKYIKKDMYSRKGVILPHDYADNSLSACVSLVQFFVNPNNELDMFIFFRGQIIDKFFNDYCNLIKCYIYVLNKNYRNFADCYREYNQIKSGHINIHVSTFHSLDMRLRDEYELKSKTRETVTKPEYMPFPQTDYDPPV